MTMYVLCMDERTTIQIPKTLRKDLNHLKIFKRDTYEEVLRRLIKKEGKINAKKI